MLGGTFGGGFSPIMNAGIIGEPDGGEPDAMVGLAQKGPVIQRTRTIAPSSPQVENVFPSDSIVFIDASAGTIPLILSIPGVPSGQQFTVKRIDADQIPLWTSGILWGQQLMASPTTCSLGNSPR